MSLYQFRLVMAGTIIQLLSRKEEKSYFKPVSFLFPLALCPKWNETFSFHIQVPELAMIRFCVEDEVSLASNEFLGQYTLPVTSLNTGKSFM